jgi:2-isopropylmalate synthase
VQAPAGVAVGGDHVVLHLLAEVALDDVDALVEEAGAPEFEVVTYREQSLSSGSGASALAYIQIKVSTGETCWGAGMDTNIELASIKAVLSAVNRAAA